MRNIGNELVKFFPTQYNKPFDFSNVGFVGSIVPSGGWTFEEPFTDSQGTLDARWSKSGTGTAPDATNDRANWVGLRTTTLHAISADPLGGIWNDTAWVWRYKNHPTTSTGGTYSSHIFLLLSSTNHTSNSETAQDSLGMSYRARNSDPRKIYHVRSDGAAPSSSTGTALSTIFANATDYWEEHTRLSSTSAKYQRFSDSGFSSSIESVTNTIASTIQNLRYVKFTNYNVAAVGGDDFTGYTTDIQIANGVTVAP